MDRATVVLVQKLTRAVLFTARNERRYLEHTPILHHGRARRSGEVLQGERDRVRVAQVSADALYVCRHQVSGYEFAVNRAFAARADAPLKAKYNSSFQRIFHYSVSSAPVFSYVLGFAAAGEVHNPRHSAQGG